VLRRSAFELRQNCQDVLQHTIKVLQNLVVPEPHHAIAMGLQPLGSELISVRAPIVLAAIDLDYEFWISAGKIDDVVAERKLPNELESKEPPSP
jgi:hypothetical protein